MHVKGSKIILVGLVGSLGSGRTAISNFLYYSYGFVKINFMDKIREVADIIGKKDIRSLQVIGHSMRAALGEDVWIRLVERRIEEEMTSRLIEAYSVPGIAEVETVLKVVVGDIGYINEFSFIKGRNGFLIGLRASEKTLYEGLRRSMDKAPSFKEFRKLLKHPSMEDITSLIEKCDLIIPTDNVPLPKVEEKVDEIVRRQLLGDLIR